MAHRWVAGKVVFITGSEDLGGIDACANNLLR